MLSVLINEPIVPIEHALATKNNSIEHGSNGEHVQTCIILAGETFSFVHESLIMCTSLSLGTILVFPSLTRVHSLSYNDTTESQPNVVSSIVKLLVPFDFDENSAFIMFFN